MATQELSDAPSSPPNKQIQLNKLISRRNESRLQILLGTLWVRNATVAPTILTDTYRVFSAVPPSLPSSKKKLLDNKLNYAIRHTTSYCVFPISILNTMQKLNEMWTELLKSSLNTRWFKYDRD
jgi:hypothetical protein